MTVRIPRESPMPKLMIPPVRNTAAHRREAPDGKMPSSRTAKPATGKSAEAANTVFLPIRAAKNG